MSDPTDWYKSSYSGDAGCVEVAFRKSTYSSGSSGCVEVGEKDDQILVRDSKLGDASPVLIFNAEEWDAFKRGMAAGEF